MGPGGERNGWVMCFIRRTGTAQPAGEIAIHTKVDEEDRWWVGLTRFIDVAPDLVDRARSIKVVF